MSYQEQADALLAGLRPKEAMRVLGRAPCRPQAFFSPCKKYRYLLSYPTGLRGVPDVVVTFVLANPSTATAETTDATVRRCIGYGERWGFTRVDIVNLRAWRQTVAHLVPPDPEAIGPDNDRWIAEAVRLSDLVVCGWGKLGGDRAQPVLDLIRAAGKKPWAIRLNQDGTPAHPVRLPYVPAAALLSLGGPE